MEKQIANSRFYISLPGGYSVKENPGPDFTVYYFLPNTEGADCGKAGFYIGGHPGKFYEGADYSFFQLGHHQLLGIVSEWKISRGKDGSLCSETIIQREQFEKIHAFVSTGNMEDLDKWITIFGTLRESGKTGVRAQVENESLTLYDFKSDNLNVNIFAAFEESNLVIDGCDSGAFVKDMFGDGDYEYKMTVLHGNLPDLFRILQVKPGANGELLEQIHRQFSGEKCFSAIREFLDANKIKYEYFSWT